MKIQKKKSLVSRLVLLLLMLMQCLPYLYMFVKAALLAMIVVLIIGSFYNRSGESFGRRYRNWVLLFYLSGVFSFVYGMLLGNPGVHYYYLTSLLWPILLPLIFSTIKYEMIDDVVSLFKISYVIILTTGIISFLNINFGIFGFINIEALGYKAADRPLFLLRAIKGGAVNSFYVLFVFFMAYECVRKERIKIVNLLLLVLGILYIVMTSRRIFLASLVYIPFIIFFIFSKSKCFFRNRNIVLIYIIPAIVAVSNIGYLFMDTSDLKEFFTSVTSEENGENIRVSQYHALLNGWLDNFIIGAGDGVNAGNVVSSDLPGSYELSYMAILFSRGTIGAFIYFGLLLSLIMWGIDMAKKCEDWGVKRYLVSYDVSYIAILIANASNPYIGAFDHYWILFLFVTTQSAIYKHIYNERKSWNIDKGLQPDSGFKI